jgi:hypothetical protein
MAGRPWLETFDDYGGRMSFADTIKGLIFKKPALVPNAIPGRAARMNR